MNLALKSALESCSSEERSEAAAFLGVLERVNDPKFQEEMARRSADLCAGRHALPSQTILELDAELTKRGL